MSGTDRLALIRAVERARLALVGYPLAGPYPEDLMAVFADAKARLDMWDVRNPPDAAVRHPDQGDWP